MNLYEANKKINDKDIYEKYKNITFGDYDSEVESLLFKQFTNPTKSKYDNVVGWILKNA